MRKTKAKTKSDISSRDIPPTHVWSVLIIPKRGKPWIMYADMAYTKRDVIAGYLNNWDTMREQKERERNITWKPIRVTITADTHDI